MPRFTGLIAASFTPFHADGGLALDKIPRLVDHLADQGIQGIYALGSTGEGPSLTFDERCSAAEAFLAAAKERLPVIVQVGHDSLRQAQQLAAHAQAHGAAAVSATAPVYFKPHQVDVLVATMAEIAAGAPDLPFYYYHIPAATGVTANIRDFLQLGAERIPTLRGIKFTAPQLHEYQGCVELNDGRFDLLFGSDEMLLGALTMGARGAVGSTYNFAAPIYQRLLTAFERGDLATAREEQAKSQALVRVLLRYEPRAAQKAIMGLIGLDCGPCRLPLRTLSREQTTALRADLSALEFFD